MPSSAVRQAGVSPWCRGTESLLSAATRRSCRSHCARRQGHSILCERCAREEWPMHTSTACAPISSPVEAWILCPSKPAHARERIPRPTFLWESASSRYDEALIEHPECEANPNCDYILQMKKSHYTKRWKCVHLRTDFPAMLDLSGGTRLSTRLTLLRTAE